MRIYLSLYDTHTCEPAEQWCQQPLCCFLINFSRSDGLKMETLYDCLREARLEKYYPAFRANGITRSESLAHLTMPEFCAMGISGAEDRRRLVELVNIIKSVHRGENRSSNAAPRKRQPGSPTQSSTRHTAGAAGGTGSSSSQSDKKVPRRHPRSPAEGAVGGSNTSAMRLEPTRDVSVRERGPNFCASSYMDMLEFVSDSSHSDPGEQLSGSFDSDSGSQVGRVAAPAPAPLVSHRLPRKTAAPVERVKQQSRSRGYNYGVPSSREVTRSKVRQSSKSTKDEKIRVCVRKRPLSRRESRASDPDIVEAGSTTTVFVKEPKVAVDLTAFTMKHEFVFDEVFDESCSNEDVYIRAARPLISTAFQRCNATFFAYGQTGAGKTHTMLGGNTVPGLYQLAGQDVFDIIASGQHGSDLHVWVSFFEIYCGQLFDLLNRRNRLVAREDGSHRVCIAGLTETEVPDVDTLIQVLEFGNSVRSRGTSGVNPDSSRSHAVLQMEIRDSDEAKLGKISFIDLAGSERASDMGDPDRQTRMEGAEINQSLLALKECIRSIDQESRHTPFRQSKLTHILKDAFVGNSRTCMIANLSPAQSACEHTLNTLRYADRVKELKKDSSQSGAGGPSFGQAMNLLMNIPITAPSIFHPSNVLSTSTPVRPRSSRQQQPPPTPCGGGGGDVTFDPSETPIRGHLVQAKPVPKVMKAKPMVSAETGGGGGCLSARQKFRPRTGRNAEAAASQGVFPAHPEASPSESDQTDTDSNNVTHPTETRPAPSQPNIPVIGSTDTEFDFPTSDFNNIDDHLNDLNQGRNDLSRAQKPAGSEGKRQQKGVDGKGQGKEQASAAAAGSPRSDSPRSSSRPGRASPGSSSSGQSSRRKTQSSSSHSHRHHSSPPADFKQSRNPQHNSEKFPTSQPPAPNPSSKEGGRSAMGELQDCAGRNESAKPLQVPRMDSFDDELLFADSGTPPQPESLGFSQSGGLGVPKVNKHLLNVMPAVQTARSSDLTSFSQRSPLRNGLDKTPPSDSPKDNPLSHPSPHNHSPLYGDTASSIKTISREPASAAKTQLPSPSIAAVRDWVSQTGDADPVLVLRGTKANTAWPENADVAENYPRNQLSGRDRQPMKTNFQPSGRGGGGGDARADSMSGPSSDPVLSNRSTPVSQGARDSISLPTQPQQQSARHDAIADLQPSSDMSSVPSSVLFSVKTTTSTALVTEKLLSGAVFSPIHPQPVSTSATRPSSSGYSSKGSSSHIVHPTPVTGTPSDSESSTAMSPGFSTAERDHARISLVGAHEDQLAAITMLCKQEMKLLLNAKKAAPRNFDDYMNRVSSVLAQKMSAIHLLQDQIRDYRARFSTQNPSAAASVNETDGSAVPHI